MREFDTILNLKAYQGIIIPIILLMVGGLVVKQAGTPWYTLLIHFIFVAVVSSLLLIYPKKETKVIKNILIFAGAGYFYTIFILYPETVLNAILVALIPGVAILFFHRLLFYILFVLNLLFAAVMFSYIFWVDKGTTFPYIYDDFYGNAISFLGSQCILLFVFILTRKRIERVMMYYEQIQKAERLRTTGQLAAAVAHEIRNPITVVNGFLQLYKEDSRVPEDVQQHFKLMLNELNAAEQVIHDFLALAKPREEKLEKVDVQDALHSVIDLLSSYALMNNIDFSISFKEAAYIQCSTIEFKQLLVNILKNAIEAMPHGGTIVISAGRAGSNMAICITDSGVGMTQEEVKLLGTPFYSLKSRGTGLGLMICYNIAKKYHGDITFTSQKGKGTTVSLQFPACPDTGTWEGKYGN
jgi:two-component system sporulation sensor kinase B